MAEPGSPSDWLGPAPSWLERVLPFLVGVFTMCVAALSMLRGGELKPPDGLGVFMGLAGIIAIVVSIRPENRRVRAWAGAGLFTCYVGRGADLAHHAVSDDHPQTSAYWYGVILGIVLFGLLAILLWVVWTRVVMPWGELMYQRRVLRGR